MKENMFNANGIVLQRFRFINFFINKIFGVIWLNFNLLLKG